MSMHACALIKYPNRLTNQDTCTHLEFFHITQKNVRL